MWITPFTVQGADEVQELRIYNWEDYISDGKDDEGNDTEDIANVIEEFEEYYEKTYGEKVSVKYVTYATNEIMLSTIETGRSQYDLICPSDYVIQKMIKKDMLEELAFYLLNDLEEVNADPFWINSAINYFTGLTLYAFENEKDINLNTIKNLDNLVKEKGINAVEAIKAIAKHIQGGGGGQPFFATAGGKNAAGLDAALREAKYYFTDKLK